MVYSTLKQVHNFCDTLTSRPDWREVIGNMSEGCDDFEVDNVRFISDDVIDNVLADELADDEYVLGCFNPSFIADVMNWPVELVEVAQNGEAYAAIGQAIINAGKVHDMARAYAQVDGYGHHFNGYDGNEEELCIDDKLYHVFDNC